MAELMSANLTPDSMKGSLKFDCGKAGVIFLADGAVSMTDGEADCTVTISEKNLEKLLSGDLNPLYALAVGKAKLAGDARIAMGLTKLLG